VARIDRIEKIVKEKFPNWEQCELEDESHQHAGRKGMESHFKLLLVTEDFEGESRVQRHRKVQSLLEKEFDEGLHAFTMRLLTPNEFEAQESEFRSPNCQGSKKK
jgi:BolA protein